MKKNIGSIDRLLRALIAALIAVLIIQKIIVGNLALFLLIISGILILTSLTRISIMYLLLGWNTYHSNKTKQTKNYIERK